MVIQRLGSDEIDEAVTVLALCFGAPMRVFADAAIRECFPDVEDAPVSLVAKTGGKIIGHVQSRPVVGKAQTRALLWLGVLAAYRGTGLGAALVAEAERLVKQDKFRDKPGTITLVAEYKTAYYEALGYRDSGRRHNGHVVMVKDIGQ